MPRKKQPPLAEHGATGLKEYDGRIMEEWLPQLAGKKKVQMFREMSDNNASISAGMYLLEMLVRQVKWEIQPTDDTPQAAAAAEFVDSCRGDMQGTWQEFISEVMTMCVYGWSYFEINYKIRHGDMRNPIFHSKYNDGKVGWKSLAIRGQDSLERWEIDEEGVILGMYQRPAPTYIERFVPIEKALLFRTRSHKNNPEGRSLLRGAYKSYYYLKRIQAIEAIGIERDLAGLPIMQVPPEIMHPNASTAQKAIRSNMQEMVQKIKRDAYEGVVLPAETSIDGTPTGYKLSLLSAGGRRPVDVDAIVKRYESRVLMSFLSEMLLLGQDKVGSFALADSKTSILAMSIAALLDSVTDVLNREAIPKLCRFNGIPREHTPELRRGDMETPDLAALGAFIQQAAGSGALVPDESLEQHLRIVAGLPTKDPEAPSVLDLPDPFDQQAPSMPFGSAPDSSVWDAESEEIEDIPQDVEVVETETQESPLAALNGAQVTAATSIVAEVLSGALPRDTASNQLQVFFNFTREQADQVLGSPDE